MSDIPTDFRRAEEQFRLKPNCTVIAVCPESDCHATYLPAGSNDSPGLYPRTCTYRKFQGGNMCGAELLRPHRVQGQIVYLPIKRFVKNSFKDWLAELLSRPGYEEKMDMAWTTHTKDQGYNIHRELTDIFDGEILRNFKGPDGQHFGLGGDEGRYVFSLCCDNFNPLGNKQAGKSYSAGMVSLICLNLPPDIRYKPENMFLYGIIPGPHEPPLDCMNHYLKFLIDEFLECWSPGVRFSRTHQYFYGRVALCALVCLVCDLVGARKTMGFGAVNHTQLCALCQCKRGLSGPELTDMHSWQRRTNEDYRASAQRYLDAQDDRERETIFKETGIRWSELLRLPYFDPSRFVVIDAMHNLFLGLIKEHFEILGIRDPEDAVALELTYLPHHTTP